MALEKIFEEVAEHFIGTQTMREFEKERNFYREFSGSGDQPWAGKVNIQMSHFYEIFNLAVGKWLPTFCELSGAAYLFELKNPNIFYFSLIISEAARALNKYTLLNPHFEKVKKLQKEVKSTLRGELEHRTCDAVKFYP